MEREKIIKSLIEEKGMSIKAFADYAKIPYTTLYSMLERGIGKASVDNVIKVCKALDITVEDLERMSEESNIEIKTIAAHATDDLTEDEQQKVIDFVKFIKSQRSVDER